MDNKEHKTLNELPVLAIRMVVKLTGVSKETIRSYQSSRLINPSRLIKRKKFYSFKDIERIKKVRDGIECH